MKLPIKSQLYCDCGPERVQGLGLVSAINPNVLSVSLLKHTTRLASYLTIEHHTSYVDGDGVVATISLLF